MIAKANPYLENLLWFVAAVAYMALLIYAREDLWLWYCNRGTVYQSSIKDLQPIFWAPFTAIAAWIGLVITKEQKTSEFRQAWIDKLRDELAALFAVSAFITQKMLDGKSLEAFDDKYAEFMLHLSSIQLRLNPTETESKNVLGYIQDMRIILGEIEAKPIGQKTELVEKLRSKFELLLTSSNRLLKLEWDRVKHGEPIFVATGHISLVCLIVIGFPCMMILILAPACK